MPTLRVRIIVIVLAVLMTAAVGGGIFALRQSETEPASVQPIDFSDFYLSGREEFSICVDAVGDAQFSEDHISVVSDALDAALDRALEIAPDRLERIPVEYSDPVFVEGCPKARLLSKSLKSQRPLDRYTRNDMHPELVVGEPGASGLSAHREFVYFIDSDTYADAFGTEPYADASEQWGAQGHVVWALTRAIYLPEDADSRAIQDGFLVTLNLITASELRDYYSAVIQPDPEVPNAPLN